MQFGLVLVASISAVVYKEFPDTAAIIGMFLIITGVVIMNVFSKSAAH